MDFSFLLRGIVAGLGLTVVSAFLVDQQMWLRLVGGVFLCYLGLRTLLARPAERAAGDELRGGGLPGAFASTFFLTLINPTTILSFAAIFAGVGVGANAGAFSVVLLVGGVFLDLVQPRRQGERHLREQGHRHVAHADIRT